MMHITAVREIISLNIVLAWLDLYTGICDLKTKQKMTTKDIGISSYSQTTQKLNTELTKVRNLIA